MGLSRLFCSTQKYRSEVVINFFCFLGCLRIAGIGFYVRFLFGSMQQLRTILIEISSAEVCTYGNRLSNKKKNM